MMTQEEFMDVQAMKRQGLTNLEIAEVTGYHRETIGFWIKNGGPPPERTKTASPVIDERWSARIAELLRPAPRLLATSIFEILAAEGFAGSYPTVARHLNDLRGPRFRAAPQVSVRIETAPGEESQFDWSDISAWSCEWGLGEVQCLSHILCWSRWRSWWFATSIDREHTFEGLVRGLEAFGGVPKVARTDRMGALGKSQGRRFSLHPPASEFARFHGMELRACQPRDAKRKGKVERPFRDVKERFLEECRSLGCAFR
jgi:transposase